MEGTCEHSEICGRDSLNGEVMCILHSEDSEKDEEAFKKALEKHWEEHGSNFRYFVFPAQIDLSSVVFENRANFSGSTFKAAVALAGATFEEDAVFREVTFQDEVGFQDALFEDSATFRSATFEEESSFLAANFQDVANFKDAVFLSKTVFGSKIYGQNAIFELGADFENATFEDSANFQKVLFRKPAFFKGVTLKNEASFQDAVFAGGANFKDAVFSKVNFRNTLFEEAALFDHCFEMSSKVRFLEADFESCEFRDGAVFTGRSEEDRAFAGGKVSFSNVEVRADSRLRFRYADLSRCRFLRTDLRNADFTGIKWCEEVSSDGWLFDEWFPRVGLYDEIYEQNVGESNSGKKIDSKPVDSIPWSEIERHYRQLKRNYENRGDFPRAGDFHIGEKVARRQNPQTSWGMRFLLTSYRVLSKYGERSLPGTLWLVGLVPMLALVYFLLGSSTCSICGSVSYYDAFLLSLEATFYPVRPIGFVEVWPNLLSIIQRVVSPVLLTLLVLALRQRVKR